MAKDATLQVRMDKELKAQVEELYRSLGTSFAEAVRVFARQSLRVGGMPFVPTLKTWDEYSQEEIDAKLDQSARDIAEGRVIGIEDLDKEMREMFASWRG